MADPAVPPADGRPAEEPATPRDDDVRSGDNAPGERTLGEGRPDDGRVLDRLRRRSTITAVSMATVTVLVVLSAANWPGWASGNVTGLIVAIVAALLGLVVTARFARRSTVWSAAAALAGGPQRGVAATIGAPTRLHPVRPSQPIKRRVTAQILPIKADLDSLRQGAALIVHGRHDRLAPTAGDDLTVVSVRSGGPFLLVRAADGAIFVAEHGLMSAI